MSYPPLPPASSVAEVERLRRSLRVYRAVVVLLTVALAGLGLTQVVGEQRATSFQLVDTDGTLRATLAPGPDGAPLLTFFSPDGRALRAIGAADDLPERLARTETAVDALQKHLILREHAALGPYFPNRPDLFDDVQREQTQRDLERLQQELRERQRELERQADRQNLQLDQLRREQERRDLQRHLFPKGP